MPARDVTRRPSGGHITRHRSTAFPARPHRERSRNHPHGDRGCQPPSSGGASKSSSRRSGGADPSSGGGLEIILTEIGGADPSSGGGLEIILTEIGGAGGSFFTMLAGAFARMACAWRSIFSRASASPCKMTTASDHVAPVHRNLPPSIRSAVIVSLSPLATFARMACAWRSIFTRAKTSTGKMTTASDHVAPVHRNLPPSRNRELVALGHLRPDGVRLALDIYEGQNLDRKNDHRIRPRRAGAPQFAPVPQS
jgi:hypothetical protein